MELLKFITCGSVDDGKSTLIGHILYKSKLIFTDQEASLEMESKVGSRGGEIDYSLLLDGLTAEREQGITIDVAYRYFSTSKRSFIVADCPGHEEYTRNMAVGTSFADLAVILVDATKGIVQQTKRHARICHLMGIKNIVLAINKMDLVEYDKHIFEKIKEDFQVFSANFKFDKIKNFPISATEGDNLIEKSTNTLWYKGDSLLSYLENIKIKETLQNGFFMSVQRVSRPTFDFRGFQGEVGSGTVKKGDEITAYPSEEKAKVEKIYVGFDEVEEADEGKPVVITLNREIDVSRGTIFTQDKELKKTDLFTGTILWMDDIPLVQGKNYYIKLGSKVVPATIMEIKHKIDINTGNKEHVDKVYKNELAYCLINTSEKIILDSFSDTCELGRFILIDRMSNMTSACGTVDHSMRRSENVVWHETDITREIRGNIKNQKPLTIWLTGLSGSGKSTIANELEKKLISLGKHTMILDGDNVRHGLNHDLGFTEKDRIENIRRIAEVSKLMNDAGIITITSFISPYESEREKAATIIGKEYFEIFIDTPLEICEKRDVKGLYKKARNGEIPNFTGVSSPYEKPINSKLRLDTNVDNLDRCIEKILEAIKERI